MTPLQPAEDRPRAAARWILGSSVALALVWGAVLIKAEGSIPQAVQSLSTSLLRGLSTLAPSVLSGWFILALAVTPTALRLVRQILPRARSLELGQFRVHLTPTDLADLAFATDLSLPLVDILAMPHREMAGADGPLQDEPPHDDAYRTCMAQLPVLFRDLSPENVSARGQDLARLEEGWSGEFTPELAASVAYLRRYARQNQVQLSGYLSITLLFRHLMLFFHGRQEHAAQLVQDLDLLDPEDRLGFLRRPVMLWILLALCRQRLWDEVEGLQRWLRVGSLERQAVHAYSLLARGRAGEAAALAEAGLIGTPSSSSFAALLAMTQGRALLELGRPLEALPPARWLLANTPTDDPGLAAPLRASARQVVARAAAALNWAEPLYALYEQVPESRHDPLVLQALAVLTGRAGQREQARQFIRQAEGLVRPESGPLARAVAETAQWLDRGQA